MSVHFNETPPSQSLTTDLIVRLVDRLYNSKDPNEQTEANRQLTEIQSSNDVWHLCWTLLDPSLSHPLEVSFFAANTLVLKINQSWTQLDEDWLENHLRPKLFETLVKYASFPDAGKLVIERLALALATFALHSIPTFWPDAIENILQTFTPQNLPLSIGPQRICDILLKILMFIPEEYAVLMPRQDFRAKLNGQMTNSGPIVFRFLHSLLVTDKSTINTECRQTVIKCLTSWTLHSRTSLLEVDDGRPLLDLLYDLILVEELCGSACATIAATFSNQKAENYRNTVIEYIPKIGNLRQAIEKYKSEDELECAIKIYSLVINFSENHSKLLLQIVLDDLGVQLNEEHAKAVKQSIFTIFRTILDCTAAPGIYGLDEKYSDISFTFWFVFFENFCYYSDSKNDLICNLFNPLVDTLLQTLIMKSQYPSLDIYYGSWNDDQRESYRCYRQDLGDNISLIVNFPRSRERILAMVHEQLDRKLTEALSARKVTTLSGWHWQGFESIVFALKSISEAVPYDETTHMPKIFSILSQIPYNESHPLLYCTVAEMLSSFSDWLFAHNTHLATAFSILFLGVNSSDSHVRLMSTLSLKDITTECQAVLLPFASQIVQSCTDAILNSGTQLDTNEKSRLMHTVGSTLAISPVESIPTALNNLTMPLLCDLMAKVSAEPDACNRAVIYDRLTIINSLIESLYVKQYSGNEYEADADENDIPYFDSTRHEFIRDLDTSQPTLGLLKQLIPILNQISAKYDSDEEIMGNISNTVKRASKSIGIELKPVLEHFLGIISNAYDPMTNSNLLEGAIPLYSLFRVDVSSHEILKKSFATISEKTLKICIANPLRQMSMAIENYFKFASQVCKKLPDIMTDDKINMALIYKLAICSLELPEKRTLAEVCDFLCRFRQKSIGNDRLHEIFVNNLEAELKYIFEIFGGVFQTPRNAIDHVTDLLFSLVDAEETRSAFKPIVDIENFPTGYVNRDQKARFVSKIMHEKNRRKFKDACSEFVLVARNLNRQS